MGLLPLIASSLGATIPQAGHIITAYALGVVVGAPLLTVLAAKWDRKALLIGLMSFYAFANILSAFAPSLGYLIVGRFLAGLPRPYGGKHRRRASGHVGRPDYGLAAFIYRSGHPRPLGRGGDRQMVAPAARPRRGVAVP